jgi:predicted dehydrogenase
MKFRLAVAGLTHGHVWGLLDQWAAQPEVELLAVADETPLLERVSGKFAKIYTDWQQMLENETPDIVLVTSDNRSGAEIATTALKAGAYVMVEKPMAADLEGAERMLQASRDTHKLLMINWPTNWSASLRKLLNLGKDGDFGQVFHFRFRTGHAGPREIGCDEYFTGWLYDEQKNGGGAIADFGGYGAKMARYLMGMPESVMAARGNYTKDYPLCDDNATILLRYPKAAAVLEATWSQIGSDGTGNPIVYGSEATATIINQQIRLHRKGQDVTMIEPEPLPDGERNAAEYFLKCIRDNRPPAGMVTPEIGRDAVAIVAAAIQSAREGRAVQPE